MPRKRLAFTLVELLIVLAIIVILVALLAPFKRNARGAARRNQCLNQIKQIALALHNYHDANGTLPPAYTVDAEGNRLHSWRTLILPYIEEVELYESIDLSKPWDDPANAKARKSECYLYVCPSAAYNFSSEEGLTTYLAIVGPECVFSGSTPRKFSEIADNPGKTIVLVDVKSDQAVHWMSPFDVGVDEVLGDPEASPNHTGIVLVAYLDGHGGGISLDIDQETLRDLLTITENETIESKTKTTPAPKVVPAN